MAFKKQAGIALAMVLSLSLVLAGCGNSDAPEKNEAPSSQEESSSAVDSSSELPEEPQSTEAALYIGYSNSGFNEYPVTLEGEMTPEKLIDEMEELTGWNLTLADEVTTGKGGMTVSFARESALLVGPPNPQKDEFFVYDAYTLDQMILDSIQKTLQMNFTAEGGDPDSLDIYYALGDGPLELPNIMLSFPMDEPYSWDSYVEMQPQADPQPVG